MYSNELESTARKGRSYVVIGGTVIVLLLMVLVGAYVLFPESFRPLNQLEQGGDNETEVRDPYSMLMENNKPFKEAEELLRADKDAEAIPLFKEALTLAQVPAERGQIMYKIAVTETRIDPIEALQYLKQIVADPEQAAIQKAYAVQHMGQIFTKNTNLNLTDVIFQGDPYASFYEEGDRSLAFRRLYEYGSDFYPLALLEIRGSGWYVTEIGKLNQQPALSEEQQIRLGTYREVVRSNLQNTEADIERTKDLENASSLIPEIYARRATLLSRLRLSGEVEFPDPESAFAEAILATAPFRGDGPSRVAYAAYLAQEYGGERSGDMQNLLRGINSNIGNYPEGLHIYLRNEKDNVLREKDSLVLITRYVPEFRTTLQQLGWEDADFQ